MEEPSTTGLTLPGGGLHDAADPGVEEVWDAMMMSSGLAEAGMEPTGDAPSSAAQGPPTVEIGGSGARMLCPSMTAAKEGTFASGHY